MIDYSGRNVWITGGASGIGLAVGKRLAGLGACITVFDLRVREDVLTELDGARRGAAVPACGFVMDVTDSEQVRRIFQLAAKNNGAPDLVLNSAGIISAVPFGKLGYDEWDRVLRVNLYGSRNVASASQGLIRPGGRLAFVASLAGIAGGYGYGAYAASKFGVVGLAEVLRVEWKPQDIAVSVICPPEVETPMVEAERRIRPAATAEMKLFAGTLTVDEAAADIVAGLVRGRYMIVPGVRGRLTYLLAKFLPRFLVHAVADRLVARALGKGGQNRAV
ncbi:MAG: SDR family NAD(P)-dependent oxidoreductase [Pseudomonadota bacterium]